MSGKQREMFPAIPVPPPAIRGPVNAARPLVFREGLQKLRAMTGQPDGPARSFLCKMLKTLNDDCAVLLAVIREADDLQPGDPKAWIAAACQARRQRKSAIDDINTRWNLGSLEEMDARAKAWTPDTPDDGVKRLR